MTQLLEVDLLADLINFHTDPSYRLFILVLHQDFGSESGQVLTGGSLPYEYLVEFGEGGE